MRGCKEAQKSTGIIRPVDELGRVVIPKEIRNMLEIVERDKLNIYVENNAIVLKKFQLSCLFCGSKKNLIEFKEKLICGKCIDNIEKL